MILRMVKPGKRDRVTLRTNVADAVCQVAEALEAAGFREVSLAGFVKHLLFWWRKKK